MATEMDKSKNNIDCHVHIFPPKRMAGAIKWIKRSVPSLPFDQTLSSEEILLHLEGLNVSFFFNFVYPLNPSETGELNRFNYLLSQRISKAICFGSLHPENNHKMKIIEEALFDFGFAGLKFHPFIQGFHPLDPRMEEVYLRMNDLEKPVVLHTGFDYFYRQKITPQEIEILLKKFPRLPLVLCHMFYPDLEGAFYLLENYPSVILDGTGVFSDFRQPISEENIFSGRQELVDGEEVYRIHFDLGLEKLEKYSDRIMFGSDYPVCMTSLEGSYGYMDQLRISDQAKRDIMFNTAFQFAKKFSLKFREIDKHI